MATINLGSIKFNWKGAYSGATAYVVDDVVESGGNSYICIAATTGNTPPNATYWELMSQAGTNGTDGTDLTTTLTTQGDIVYRDASGLARLGAGTSGQVLQTNGTGANPSWGTVSSDFVKLASVSASASSTLEIDGYYDDTTYSQYKIVFDKIKLSTSTWISFRVKNSTGTLTSSIYEGSTSGFYPLNDGTGSYYDFYDSNYNMNYSSNSGHTTYTIGQANTSTNANAEYYFSSNSFMCGELFSNNTADTSLYKSWHGLVNYTVRPQNYTGQGFYEIRMGIADTSTAHTGFVMYPLSGTITSGSMHLYGFKK